MRNDVEKKQKSNVDIMKFILSIMVVCIHTGVTSLMPAEIGKLVNSIFNLGKGQTTRLSLKPFLVYT